MNFPPIRLKYVYFLFVHYGEKNLWLSGAVILLGFSALALSAVATMPFSPESYSIGNWAISLFVIVLVVPINLSLVIDSVRRKFNRPPITRSAILDHPVSTICGIRIIPFVWLANVFGIVAVPLMSLDYVFQLFDHINR